MAAPVGLSFTKPPRFTGQAKATASSRGRLLNPEITDGDFAKQLFKHLESADGILVLAEATVTDQQAERVLHDLHKLREALMLVSEKRRQARSDPFPVGLVYDKWDRCSRMEKFSLPEAQVELTEFMAQSPPPPHVALRNVLQAVAGESSYFREFVVSAFGKSKQAQQQTANGSVDVEIPASVSPLLSYGLEDPFVEICRAAETLELSRLTRETLRLSPWKVWQLPGRRGIQLALGAKSYARRFPRHMPQHKSGFALAALAMKRFRQQLAVAFCTVAVFFMISIQTGFAVYDEAMFAEHGPAISKSFNENDFESVQTSLPKWKRAEEYLGKFQTPTWYRWTSHWRNSRKWAAEQRSAVLNRIGLASVLVGTHDNLQSQLNEFTVQQEQLHSSADADTMIKRLDALQVPRCFPLLDQHKTEVRVSLRQVFNKWTTAEGVTRLSNELDKYLENGNLTEAAHLLFQAKSQFPEQIEDLQRRLRQNVPGQIENKLRRLCEPLDKSAGNWSSATDYLARLDTNTAFLDLMGGDFRGKLSRAQDWVVKHRQMTVYRHWYDDKGDPTKADLARQVGYREVVDRYDEYTLARNIKRDWTVRIDRLHFIDDGARSATNAKLLTYCDNAAVGTVSPFLGHGDNMDATGSGEMTISGQSIDSRFVLSTTVLPINWNFTTSRVTGELETSISALSAGQKKLSCGTKGATLQCDVFISVDLESLPKLGNIPPPVSPSELSLR